MSLLQPLGCFTPFCRSTLQPSRTSDATQRPVVRPERSETLESTTALATGLLTGMLGGSAISQRLSKPLNKIENALTYLPTGIKRQQYLNFNSPLFALVRLATLYQQYHGPLLAYMVAGVLGAVSTSFLQGIQETWVRQQETSIRANLIKQLMGSYEQSIQQKYAWDDQLRSQTHQRIADLLRQHEINPQHYLTSNPIQPVQTTAMSDALFPFMPTDRQIPSRFGQQSKSGLSDFPLSGLSMALFVTGSALGAMLHHLLQWLAAHREHMTPQAQEVLECIITSDLESTFLHQNKAMLAAVFGLTAMAKIGQLLLNTAREVEVTRHNADTELRYQQANWLQLDPRFHALAEQSAMLHDLALFQNDLPWLKNKPAILQERVNTLLANRGRSSPPPYFLATPPVMLTEAKG